MIKLLTTRIENLEAPVVEEEALTQSLSESDKGHVTTDEEQMDPKTDDKAPSSYTSDNKYSPDGKI